MKKNPSSSSYLFHFWLSSVPHFFPFVQCVPGNVEDVRVTHTHFVLWEFNKFFLLYKSFAIYGWFNNFVISIKKKKNERKLLTRKTQFLISKLFISLIILLRYYIITSLCSELCLSHSPTFSLTLAFFFIRPKIYLFIKLMFDTLVKSFCLLSMIKASF